MRRKFSAVKSWIFRHSASKDDCWVRLLVLKLQSNSCINALLNLILSIGKLRGHQQSADQIMSSIDYV